jgi:hypothetical protein
MATSLLDRLFRRPRHPIDEDICTGSGAAAYAPAMAPQPRQTVSLDAGGWTVARVAQAAALWGDGFVWPGGAEEIKRLAAPFGLSAAQSLLFLGSGAGGPARTLASELGTWVQGYEADPVLREEAGRRIQRAGVALAKRATILPWDGAVPALPERRFHHAILLEVLPAGDPVPLLEAAVGAVKLGGQVAVVQMVRAGGERAVGEALAAAGCDLRVVEDESARHGRLVVQGWKQRLRELGDRRPTPAEAAPLVAEAAYWTHRLRDLRERRSRFMRWGAIVAR